jgi:hypothetical protein
LARITELPELLEDQRERLQGFLVATDQVKYAARPPTEDDVAKSYELALSFVEATAKQPEEALEEGSEEVVDG